MEKQLTVAKQKAEIAAGQEIDYMTKLKESTAELKTVHDKLARTNAELTASLSEGAKLVKEREKIRQEIENEQLTRQTMQEKLSQEIEFLKNELEETAARYLDVEKALQSELDDTKKELKHAEEQKESADESVETLQRLVYLEVENRKKAVAELQEERKAHKGQLEKWPMS